MTRALLFFVTILSLSSDWAWAKDSLPRTIPRRAVSFGPPLQNSFYLPESKPEIDTTEEGREKPETDEWSIHPTPKRMVVAVTVDCPAVRMKVWAGYYRLKCFDGKIWGNSQIFLSIQDVRRVEADYEPEPSSDSTTFYFVLRRSRLVEVAHK